MLAIAPTTEQKVKINSAPLTASGKPVTLTAPLTVSVTSGDGTFTQDPADFASFFAVSGSAAAATTYAVSYGGASDTVEMTVSAVPASTLGLTAGTPEPK